MKAILLALAFLAALGLTLSPLGPLSAAETGSIHQGKGTVLSVDMKEGRLVMTEEPRGNHLVFLDHQTRIFDERGSSMPAAALQPGDLIREECLLMENGKGLAREIRLLRPAWMDTTSVEQ